MSLRRGVPAKKSSTDSDDTRYDWRNLVVCNADGTPRGGVTSPVGVPLVSATATMNVAVAVHSAVEVRDNGVVFLAVDAVTNVLLDPAPGSNSRIDVIAEKQNDSSSTVSVPDANDLPQLIAIKGPSTLPLTKPPVPAGYVELATVQVPAGATATNSGGVTITQTAQFTAAPGGAVPFRTKADLDLWTTAMQGQHANVFADPITANNGDYFNNSGVWARIVSGRNIMRPSTIANGVLSGVGTVTFTNLPSTAVCRLDGVFTAAFPVYEVIIRVKSATAAANVIAQLAAGGVVKGTGYDGQSWYSSSATAVAGLNPNINDAKWQLTIGANTQHFIEIRIAGPAEAVQTMLNSIDNSYSGTGVTPTFYGGGQRDAIAFDGLAVAPLSNSMTGTIQVYGLAA